MLYLADPDFRLYCGDATEELREVEAESVDCCITSPPYFQLRDYGTGSWDGGDLDCDHAAAKIKTRYGYSLANSPIQDGSRTGTDGNQYKDRCPDCGARRVDHQIGLEQTVGAYVNKLVRVFQEVRRVLKPSGTLWLNLGSTYASGQLLRDARRSDTAYRELRDSPDSGSSCFGLCDECAASLGYHNAGTHQLGDESEQPAELKDRDSEHPDSGQGASDAGLLDARVSTIFGSSAPPPEWCWRCGSHPASVFLQAQPTSSPGAQASGDMEECSSGTAASESGFHTRGRDASGTAWLNYIPKEKDLVPIPWLVALALQTDGWYLRADVIWSKPNVMPESAKDRPTRSHEYIFLFAKLPNYFYNYEATLEPHTGDRWGGPVALHTEGWKGGTRIAERDGRNYFPGGGRNMRSVWEMATESLPDAHYAPFPQELVKRCIQAGAPDGGLVLDPFLGSGTTAYVARKMGRRCVGIELSRDYCELIRVRTQQLSLFAQEAVSG